MTWIETQFPDAVGKHEIKSNPDEGYNCIAYAANEKAEWWSHQPGYKWPAQRSPKVESLISVFAAIGFKVCKSAVLEDGWERVAVYEKRGMWTHAARQVESGKWVSKLGPDEDIEHDDPHCLCGDKYGEVHCIMRRARA